MKFFLSFFIIFIIIIQCNSNPSNSVPQSKYYKPQKTEHLIVRYFKQKNQKEKIDIAALSNLVEYYKVTYNKFNTPIKEEYYKNGLLQYYNLYNYASDNNTTSNKIKSIIKYNNSDDKILEKVFQNDNIVQIEYKYHPKLKYLTEEIRYKNNVLDGWSLKYDQEGNIIQKTLYEDGNLKTYWVYVYNKENQLVSEKNFDSSKKLIYEYNYEL